MEKGPIEPTENNKENKKPFYKSWSFGIVVVVVLCIIILSTTDKEHPAAVEAVSTLEAASTPSKSAVETLQPTPSQSQTQNPALELSSFGVSSSVTIQVEGTETLDVIRQPYNKVTEAKGVFKLVKVTLLNDQKSAILLSESSFRLIDDMGKKYTHSLAGQYAYKTAYGINTGISDTLNPGKSKTGIIVFDVPKDAKGFVLEASGGFFGEEILLKVD